MGLVLWTVGLRLQDALIEGLLLIVGSVAVALGCWWLLAWLLNRSSNG